MVKPIVHACMVIDSTWYRHCTDLRNSTNMQHHLDFICTSVLLYILCISMGIIINGVTPLYYEMACELAFPVQEGLATALMVIGNNLFGVMFFLLFLIPQLSKGR